MLDQSSDRMRFVIGAVTVGAGETKTIHLVGHGDDVSHLQMQLLTARNDIDLDVTVSNLKLGYYI